MNDIPKKRRGRPPGVKSTKLYTPREGSRPYALFNMKPGERVFLEAPRGRSQAFQQQVASDIVRVGCVGKITQTLILGIEPTTRTVHELVMLTRKKEE